jgi:hypothetical protein
MRRARHLVLRFPVRGLLAGWVLFLGILAGGGIMPCTAWAKPPAVIRVTSGDHPYFGRVVLNAPGLSYAVNRDGDHVVIMFSDDPIFGELPPTPRNVLAIRAVPGGIELTVPLGANVRTTRMGDKVVVDIDDTVANRPPLAPLTDVQPPPQHEQSAAPANGTRPAPPSETGSRAPGGGPGGTTPGRIPAAGGNTAAGHPAGTGATGIAAPGRQRAQPPLASEGATAAAVDAKPGPGPEPAAPNLADAAATPLAAEIADATKEPQGTAAIQTDDARQVPAPTGTAEGPPAEAQPDAVQAQRGAIPQGAIQVWPVTEDTIPTGPPALRAARSRPPGGLAGVAAVIPFRASVGAAMFARGPDTNVVFDERRSIDLAALRDDPAFGSAIVTLYPTATVIRFACPPGQSAMLSYDRFGWRLSVVPTTPKPAAIPETTANNVMTFTGGSP